MADRGPNAPRTRFCRMKVAREHANVEVSHFENLFLARYAKSIGATSILRGIRNEADYTYERTIDPDFASPHANKLALVESVAGRSIPVSCGREEVEEGGKDCDGSPQSIRRPQ